MTKHYQVVGNPIAQSKSPFIHMAFAQQTQQHISYQRACPEVDGFLVEAQRFFASGGLGMNVTAPFKLDAYNFASQLTPRATLAGAVNTLAVQEEGSILGDNTDGYGLVTDITQQLGWPLRDKKLLVLGAGGAVRGVLQMLLEQRPAQLVLANRTLVKAEALASVFAPIGPVETVEFDALSGFAHGHFDLIINATSASLAGDLPPVPETLIAPATYCYDMTYGAQPTVFLRWVASLGVRVSADGLGMLVGQAAESFRLWHGVMPEVKPVMAALRQHLKA
ncbi:shikimate dehydrogenase [Simiduia curdlanivorans]|uniref:Shikimate dehydrogenase (NADP(+)) n=1 Tax=Simiduia curdlanivorans TaxID=1492769 RepID=A0ABV8UZQ3_9GAMM|nr:shikimate dehydrogenase [Simiduia curdlanivorans]MDN3638019.1 shikimate dehydrogenase [Simiduia curdlanivorans]